MEPGAGGANLGSLLEEGGTAAKSSEEGWDTLFVLLDGLKSMFFCFFMGFSFALRLESEEGVYPRILLECVFSSFLVGVWETFDVEDWKTEGNSDEEGEMDGRGIGVVDLTTRSYCEESGKHVMSSSGSRQMRSAFWKKARLSLAMACCSWDRCRLSFVMACNS